MTVYDLSRAQLIQLKAAYYDQQHPEGVSYGELAAVDDLVSDEEVIAAYDGVNFVEDDFLSDPTEGNAITEGGILTHLEHLENFITRLNRNTREAQESRPDAYRRFIEAIQAQTISDAVGLLNFLEYCEPDLLRDLCGEGGEK